MVEDYYQNKYNGMYKNILSANPRENYGGIYQNKRQYYKTKHGK